MTEGSRPAPIEALAKEVDPVYDLENLALNLSGREQRVVKLFASLEQLKKEGRIPKEDYKDIFIETAKELLNEMTRLKGEVGLVARSQVFAEIDPESKAQSITSIPGFKQSDPETSIELARATLDKVAAFAEQIMSEFTKEESSAMGTKAEKTAEEPTSEAQEIKTDFLKKLSKVESQSIYGVTHEHNEIEDTHKELLAELETLKTRDPGEKELFKELKETLELAIYKIYRRTLLDNMTSDEIREKDVSKWDNVYQPEMLYKAHNIVEEVSGLKISSVEDLEQGYKNEMAKMELLRKETAKKGKKAKKWEFPTVENLLEEIEKENGITLDDEKKRLVLDYLNLGTEYTARKFAHISWMANRVEITGISKGKDASRHYVEVNQDEGFPIVYLREYLFKGGLADRGFGEPTKMSFGEAKARVYGLKEAKNANGFELIDKDKRGEITFEKTIYGETWRALDRWAYGELKHFVTKIDSRNFHFDIGGLVSAIKNYLVALHPEKESEINGHTVLRATRHWIMETYHQSALAMDSATLSDNAYYQDNIFDYNEKYSEGRASWNITMIRMLFAKRKVEKVSDGKGGTVLEDGWVNVLQTYLKEHKKLESTKGLIDKVFNNKPYTRMVNSLKEAKLHSETSDPEDRKDRILKNHVANYDFLLSPLLRMDEKRQAQQWQDVVKEGKIIGREYLTIDKDGNVVNDGKGEPIYQSKYFTQMPIFATLFLKDNEGNNQFYKSKNTVTGEPNTNKPISLFDIQDEYGELPYEWFYKQSDAFDLTAMISSKAFNGYNFLADHLKSGDVLSKLEDPKSAGGLANQIVYALPHLPDVGNIIAAIDLKKKDEIDTYNKVAIEKKTTLHPWTNLDKRTKEAIISMEVFAGIIIRILDKRTSWGMDDVRDYLANMIDVDSPPIPPEMEKAIRIVVESGFGFAATTQSFMNDISETIKKADVF